MLTEEQKTNWAQSLLAKEKSIEQEWVKDIGLEVSQLLAQGATTEELIALLEEIDFMYEETPGHIQHAIGMTAKAVLNGMHRKAYDSFWVLDGENPTGPFTLDQILEQYDQPYELMVSPVGEKNVVWDKLGAFTTGSYAPQGKPEPMFAGASLRHEENKPDMPKPTASLNKKAATSIKEIDNVYGINKTYVFDNGLKLDMAGGQGAYCEPRKKLGKIDDYEQVETAVIFQGDLLSGDIIERFPNLPPQISEILSGDTMQGYVPKAIAEAFVTYLETLTKEQVVAAISGTDNPPPTTPATEAIPTEEPSLPQWSKTNYSSILQEFLQKTAEGKHTPEEYEAEIMRLKVREETRKQLEKNEPKDADQAAYWKEIRKVLDMPEGKSIDKKQAIKSLIQKKADNIVVENNPGRGREIGNTPAEIEPGKPAKPQPRYILKNTPVKKYPNKQAYLKSIINSKSDFYDGFVKDKPQVVDLFGTKFVVKASEPPINPPDVFQDDNGEEAEVDLEGAEGSAKLADGRKVSFIFKPGVTILIDWYWDKTEGEKYEQEVFRSTNSYKYFGPEEPAEYGENFTTYSNTGRVPFTELDLLPKLSGLKGLPEEWEELINN